MAVSALPVLNVLPADELRALILAQHQELLSTEDKLTSVGDGPFFLASHLLTTATRTIQTLYRLRRMAHVGALSIGWFKSQSDAEK